MKQQTQHLYQMDIGENFSWLMVESYYQEFKKNKSFLETAGNFEQ
jgi:hypothetical protein